MRAFSDIALWAVHSLGESPYPNYWTMNPSILRTPDSDGGRWLCSVRCSNYHMPGSTFAKRPKNVTKIHNRNLLLELDPATWRVVKTSEISDRTGDKNKGTWNGAGFEDLRLVWVAGAARGRELCALASAMRPDAEAGGVNEICLLELELGEVPASRSDGSQRSVVGEVPASRSDGDVAIVAATPLRGSWSNQHQKNWSPFQGESMPRILYSPLDGGVHDRSGRIVPTHDPLSLDAHGNVFRSAFVAEQPEPQDALPTNLKHGAIEVQLSRRFSPPANGSKPKIGPVRLALRGGTQLVNVPSNGESRWIGLAHGCRIEYGRKTYWHQLYQVDELGSLLALSEPFKLAPNVGIEFAAGLAVDHATGRAAISFGTEDESAWIGETTIDGLVALLRPIGAAPIALGDTAQPKTSREPENQPSPARGDNVTIALRKLADRLDARAVNIPQAGDLDDRAAILRIIANEIRSVVDESPIASAISPAINDAPPMTSRNGSHKADTQ